MFWEECAELGWMVEGGTEDRVWNSDRFLRISSREAALEGLEKMSLKGLKVWMGLWGSLKKMGKWVFVVVWD